MRQDARRGYPVSKVAGKSWEDVGTYGRTHYKWRFLARTKWQMFHEATCDYRKVFRQWWIDLGFNPVNICKHTSHKDGKSDM